MLDFVYTKEYDVCKEKARMWIFEIHCTPRPQKQTRVGKTYSGQRMFYDPSKMDRKMIQWQIRPHAPKELLMGALEMHLTFYMPIPKNIKGVERQAMINGLSKHYKRPDLDNLAYVVTNALKEIVYLDDSQICKLVLEKCYSEQPKTVIKVMEV